MYCYKPHNIPPGLNLLSVKVNGAIQTDKILEENK